VERSTASGLGAISASAGFAQPGPESCGPAVVRGAAQVLFELGKEFRKYVGQSVGQTKTADYATFLVANVATFPSRITRNRSDSRRGPSFELRERNSQRGRSLEAATVRP
jgi:hypothetical protein